MNTIEDITITVTSGNNAGKAITLSRGESAVVGRSSSSDFNVTDLWLSRAHFRIEHDGLNWTVTDLESRHGTLVNNQKATVAVLGKDDIVFAGSTRFCITFGRDRPVAGGLLRQDSSAGIRNILKSLTSKSSDYKFETNSIKRRGRHSKKLL